MNDVVGIQYQYTPKDPNGHYVANVSMVWVEGSVYDDMLSHYSANTVYSVASTGISGYIKDLSMTPLVPEWGYPASKSGLYYNGSISIISYDPFTYRVVNVQYQYIPKDPNNNYTADVSVEWLPSATRAGWLGAQGNGTLITIAGTGVSGYVRSVSVSPTIPEWSSETAPYFSGSVSVISYDPYTFKVTNISYQYIPRDPNNNYLANISVQWLASADYADLLAHQSARTVTSIAGAGITGYVQSLSMSPTVPEWPAATAPYFNGSLSISTLDPYGYKITNLRVSGQSGAITKSISGNVVFQYVNTNAVGRNIDISVSWVSSTVLNPWKSAYEAFTAITVGGYTLIMMPNNGLSYQPMQSEWDATAALIFYNVTITGVVSA